MRLLSQDELRIAHCGGFHSRELDRIVSLINAVAKMLGRPEMTWDSASVGCSPSLSSIPVKEQRWDGGLKVRSSDD